MRFITTLLFIILSIITTNVSSFWVVSSEENVKSEVRSKNDLLLIFSLKKTHWNNGNPISVVVLSSNNRIHQDFVREILGINHNILDNLWNIKIYSGNIAPPTVVKTKEELIEYIRENNSAIGYIYSNDIPGVITFEIDQELLK